MALPQVGVAIHRATPEQTLDGIVQAEELGLPAAWLTTGGAGPDALTLFAAAAVRTSRVRLGTAIVPTFPRHPVVTLQQAQVVAALAPGRFRLGIGPSHRPTIESVFGVPFERPLTHLREYVAILRAGLRDGTIDHRGTLYQVRGRVPAPADVPILLSALRPASFTLAGEITDGAISWITPAAFLRDVARPALEEGARAAGRATPALIGHTFAVLSTDADAVRSAAHERLSSYLRMPFYQAMLNEAGFPEALSGELSDRLIDAIVIHGDDSMLDRRLRDFLAHGIDELIVSTLPVGPDVASSDERTLRALASL